MKYMVVICLSIVSSLTCVAQENLFDAAYNEFTDGRFYNADSLFTLALKNPAERTCDALRIRGISRFYLHDTTAAWADIRDAIKICPNDANTYFSQGNLQMLLSNPKAATTDFTKAISLNPLRVDFYLNRALAFYMTGDSLNFLEDTRTGLALNPRNPQINNNLAVFYRNAKDYSNAIYYYQLAFDNSSRYVDCQYGLAFCFYEVGQYDKALTYCIKASKIDQQQPLQGQILFLLGKIELKLGDKVAACKAFRNASALKNIDAESYLTGACGSQ